MRTRPDAEKSMRQALHVSVGLGRSHKLQKSRRHRAAYARHSDVCWSAVSLVLHGSCPPRPKPRQVGEDARRRKSAGREIDLHLQLSRQRLWVRVTRPDLQKYFVRGQLQCDASTDAKFDRLHSPITKTLCACPGPDQPLSILHAISPEYGAGKEPVVWVSPFLNHSNRSIMSERPTAARIIAQLRNGRGNVPTCQWSARGTKLPRRDVCPNGRDRG
jgi:hypothetical protein